MYTKQQNILAPEGGILTLLGYIRFLTLRDKANLYLI